jgi:hypothetical protein
LVLPHLHMYPLDRAFLLLIPTLLCTFQVRPRFQHSSTPPPPSFVPCISTAPAPEQKVFTIACLWISGFLFMFSFACATYFILSCCLFQQVLVPRWMQAVDL